ncbi:DUF5906 domain-containing protein [Undibacterium curvum]|uniref:DUF5906 domain-containing protein n=1 Tax=Undibacterium curvum TaxID=2762294 RepID=UPI003D10029D
MTLEEICLGQMIDAGYNNVPPGHPVLDGTIHRFGRGKKSWYIARRVALPSGKETVSGAFGTYHGEDNGAIKFKGDVERMSDADRAALVTKQNELARIEREKEEEKHRLAANRARQQWGNAVECDHAAPHPYLVKKQVPAFGLRLSGDGDLWMPLWADGGCSPVLRGLQKIDANGKKRYNTGLNKDGAAFHLTNIPADAELIDIGEGYATCASVLLAAPGSFVVCALDAGNLMPVAKHIRATYPNAHIRFIADDDYLMLPRFIERLREQFNLSLPEPVIDGQSRTYQAADGEPVEVTAWWRTDPQGIAYIEADMRKGRMHRAEPFHNAGLYRSHEAAAAVGNASVIHPVFSGRDGQKWTDFNDLHALESLDAVASQINAFSPAPPLSRSDFSCAAPPLPPEGKSEISAAQALQGEEKTMIRAAGAPLDDAIATGLSESEPEIGRGAFSLERILETHALVLGTTDIWDEPNQLRFKKAAFVDAVGKEVYTLWLSSPDRKSIKLDVEKKPAAAKRGEGARAKFDDDDYWTKVERLISNFTLIYGSDEVFDGERREIIKINPLRLAFTNDVVKAWLNFKERKMVPRENVVFDPTYSVDPKTSLNLFDGFAMKPQQGNCDLILALLSYLCGDDVIAEWVLKWLAYPLQNPGAKMASAIIMHGDEGSGKNLFFEKCIKSIYGKYAGVIGNQEIESQFNEWASQKLFMVCDEVVTRAEMRQMKGRLKQITANDSISINPKNLSQREERNHINFVFLSNETQPLALDRSDRRYLVVWTPPKQSADFYQRVAEQMESGGNEAFYHFLVNLDLGDFNAHTKPIMTEAKRDLIELGLSTSERFFHDWSSQNIPVPFISCTAQQLYDAFIRWCALHGERFPPSQSKFGRDIKRVAGNQILASPVNVTVGASKRQLICYWVGEQPEGTTREQWINASSSLFDRDLDSYRRSRNDTNGQLNDS